LCFRETKEFEEKLVRLVHPVLMDDPAHPVSQDPKERRATSVLTAYPDHKV
jgi:hypothetical protein